MQIRVHSGFWPLRDRPGNPAACASLVAAEYDGNKKITIKGVVTKVEWMNPTPLLRRRQGRKRQGDQLEL